MSSAKTHMQLAEGEETVIAFSSYEEYLDTFITEKDMFYLEDRDLARNLVELGYKGKEVLKRADFEEKKRLAETGPVVRKKDLTSICSAGKTLTSPLLRALQEREEHVRSGKIATIVFIRDYNSKGHEISGYIDYGHRLRNEEFEAYFDSKKKLLPQPSDLSFYNWKTQTLSFNSSTSFEVLADDTSGVLFKYRRDRKILNVDPKTSPGDNSSRVSIEDPDYKQIVLFDHIARRKNQ